MIRNDAGLISVTVALPRELVAHLEAMGQILGVTLDAQVREGIGCYCATLCREFSAELERRRERTGAARRAASSEAKRAGRIVSTRLAR